MDFKTLFIHFCYLIIWYVCYTEFDTENQKESPVERTEAGVQVDVINQDEITKLEAKVAKLSQEVSSCYSL